MDYYKMKYMHVSLTHLKSVHLSRKSIRKYYGNSWIKRKK